MTRLFILNVFLMVVVCNTFEFNCPDRSQWKYRAGEKCNGSINMYFCIFDDNYNIYREFCHQDTRYNRGPEGETFVYRGNLDGKTCSSERYQPIKFNNMGNSDCIFTKSLCSSEGLVAYTNGSPTSERTCVCDCTKNYLFVTQPQNKSFCRPDIEDCSCGKKICSRSYVIPRADFSCVSRGNASSDAVKDCERIPISNEEETILVLDNSSVEENSRVHNKKRPGKIVISALVIISFIVPVLIVIVGKPRILAQHEYYHAAIGAPVRIRFKIHSCCKLRSLNVRRIDRNGTTVIPSDNIELHTDSTGTYAEVVFFNVHENDEGTYIALYNNIFGYDKCTVKLKVQAFSRIDVICKNDKNAVLRIQLSEKDKRTLQAVEWEKNTENLPERIASVTRGELAEIPAVGKYKASIEPLTLEIIDCNQNDRSVYTCHLLYKTEKYIHWCKTDKDTLNTSQISRVYTTADLAVAGKDSKNKDTLNTSQISRVYTTDDLAVAGKDSKESNLEAQFPLPKLDAVLAQKKSKQFLEEEIRVVCIGKAGVGKSATCNTLAGEDIFQSECSPSSVTQLTDYRYADVFGSKVLIIDTPGIFESKGDEAMKRTEIEKCVEIGAPGIHAFLFVMEIDRFREEDEEVIKTFGEYFGRENLANHTILVFTHSNKLQNDRKTIESFLDNAKVVLKTFLKDCGNRHVAVENSLQFQNNYNERLILFNAITKLKTLKDFGFILDEVENEIESQEEKIANHLAEMFKNEYRKAEVAYQKALEELSFWKERGNEEHIERIKSGLEATLCGLKDQKAKYETKLSNIREKVRKKVKLKPIKLNLKKNEYCA